MMLFSFFILMINRVTGLALPYSSRFLLDGVIPRRPIEQWALPHLIKAPILYLNQHWGLSPLVLLVIAVVAATVIQGSSSYTLPHFLSKEAHPLLAHIPPPRH